MSNYQHEDEVSSGMLNESEQNSRISQIKHQDGLIDIDLSNAEDCDEKEMIIQFKIGENATKDILCVWHLALSKLRCNLSTVDDENEWFDEYSIYTKSTQALIKSENDFTHYFQQCINTGNASDAVTTPTLVPIIVKNISWVDEYKYINNWLIDNGNEKKTFMESSDKYIDCLIDHFVNRIKILEKIDDSDNEVDTKLSEEETSAMMSLFDRLIALRKEEGIHQIDGCLEFIEEAKENLRITDDTDSLEEVIKLLKNMLDKTRLFNVGKFLNQYKKHESSCQSLLNENVVLFIGSTGAGKSTTIYFLKGIEMEKDDCDHIGAKSSESLSNELLNVKLQQSIRSSVTTDITPVTVMLKDELSQYSECNEDDGGKNNNNNKSKLKDKVIFCDTPGFGDTKGDAIDIANKFGLINAMQLSSFVGIVVVICKEDIVGRRMEGLKKLCDNLYQYLSNYRSMEGSSNIEGKQNDNDHATVTALENENFMEKLKDINIIFTKFSSIKAIKKCFSDKEMKKLEKEHKENKNAFYYLNKYINSLVKNDGIVLIDPIKGDYKQALYKMFVSSDAKWIKATENNFEAGVIPEKKLTIKEQVKRHCEYIKRVIDSNTGIIFGGSNMHKNVDFDYFRLVEHKMNELKEMCNILGSGIVAYANTIQNVTDQWNKICDLTIEKAIQCCNNNNNNIEKNTNNMTIQEYKEYIGVFKHVLQELLVKYSDFCQNHLQNGKTEEEMRRLIFNEFITLLNNSKLGLTKELNNNSDTSNLQREGATQQPPENKAQDITILHDNTRNIGDDKNDLKSHQQPSNMTNITNGLLQCLVILEHFGSELSDEFDKYLKQLYDECLDYIEKTDFVKVVSVLKFFNATLNSGDHLESKQLLKKTHNNIKNEVKKWVDSQSDSVATGIRKIDGENNHETKQDPNTSIHDDLYQRLDELEKDYNVLYRGCDTLEQYFVSDELIHPQETMNLVHAKLKQCCEGMKKKIDVQLNNDKMESGVIRHLVHSIDALMKIYDKNSSVDDILNTIVKSISDLDKIIDEMKWMIEYHSSKDTFTRVFKSGVILSKINDLNDYIAHRSEIQLSTVKQSEKNLDTIANFAIAICRCYYDGYKLIHGDCNINKVIELIDPSIGIVRKRIDEIVEDLLGIELSKENETENEESKTGETKIGNKKSDVNIENEQANNCLQLFEHCKKLSLCNGNSSEFSVQLCLVTEATRTTVENYFRNYFDNRGQWLCKSITNGLKYFDDLLDNLIVNTDGNYHLSDAGYYADIIAEIADVESSWKQHKLLNDYLFRGKDMNTVIAQWKRGARIIYDKLAKMASKKDNSSVVVSSALAMCKALTIVDNCGILEQYRTFNSLKQKIELLIDQECQQLTQSIGDRNFGTVLAQFKQQQKQLLVAGKYDIPREYLASEMLTIIKQTKILVKELPETQFDKYKCKIQETIDELIKQMCEILKLGLIEYIDDKNKNKWNESLEQLFEQATSTASVILLEISENMKQSKYDKLQTQMEILNDIESKLIVLQPFFKTGKYDLTSKQEITKLSNKIEEQLKKDITKLNTLDIEQYHELSQPSVLCKTLSSAVNTITQFNDNFTEQLKLTKYYTQAREKIEKAFYVVFERECKNVVKVQNCWYQHSSRVVRARELAESLPDGGFKDRIVGIFNEMQRKFDQMKQKEDDKIISSFKNDKTSLMKRFRDAKNSFWDVATHSSKLHDLDEVYKEYLQRVKYNDQIMKQKLISIILVRIINENKEIQSYLRENKSFNTDLSSINNLYKRLDKFQKDVNNILGDKSCGRELKSSVSNLISVACKTNHKDIQLCKDGIKSHLNKIEVIQKWFAHKENSKTVRIQFISQLLKYILRLIKGLLCYCTSLQLIINLANIQTIVVDIKAVEKEVCDLLNQFFDKSLKNIEKMITSNKFEECKTNFETMLIFENDEGMKEIRAAIHNSILRPFSCNIVSTVVKNHLKSIQNTIVDKPNGLGIVNGGDIGLSMQMRIRKYKKLKKTLEILRASSIIDKYLKNHSNFELYSQCVTLISAEIKAATESIATQINKPSEQSFRNINHLFDNLWALTGVGLTEELKNGHAKEVDKYVSTVRRKIILKLKQIQKDASSKYASLDTIKRSMIILQMAKDTLTHDCFHDVVTNGMKKVLDVQKKQHGIFRLSQLFTDLNATSTTITCDEKTDGCDVKSDENNIYWCTQIINSHAMFSGTLIYLFNTKQSKNAKDIDVAIDRMMVGATGDSVLNHEEKIRLKSLYVSFDEQYWGLINKYMVDSNIKNSNDLNQVFRKLHDNISCFMKNHDIARCSKVIQLMAHIFCIWTMLDCEYFLSMKNHHNGTLDHVQNKSDQRNDSLEICKSYLRQPNAAQVLAIMRLVGMNETMESSLIEIKTGEGKSLVLAISACVFALLGFNPYHISFSQLSSSQDFRRFQDLFIQLQVEKKICYTTLHGVFGSALNAMTSKDEDILKLLSNSSNYKHDKRRYSLKPSKSWDIDQAILLIDEVDVLFNQRYLGKSFWKCLPLQHKVLSPIADMIWDLHNSGDLYKKFDANEFKIMQMIKNSHVYGGCVTIFGFWMPLIDKQIAEMIRDVQRFQLASHNYIVRKNKIGYLHEDRISYYIEDYRTMFAYYKEHQRGRISKEALERKKLIVLCTGGISCAEFPCLFRCIAGVTATLSQLEINYKEFLANKYQINKYTYVGTMYEENQVKFDPLHDVIMADSDNWRLLLVKQVNERMGSTKPRRPVLIFFENNNDLEEFWKNCNIQDDCQCVILNEELTIHEKKKVIKDSCHLNTVTLCARVFGRGTDFVVTDERVNKMGGPHVIQAFFSDDISEEIQIKGRTARNGGNGSFSMVLNGKKIGNMYDTYDQLNKERTRLQKYRDDKALEAVKTRKIYHDSTIVLRQHVAQGKRNRALELLIQLNDAWSTCEMDNT